MKKVLWVSRHTMTPDQFSDLERVMGEPVELIQWKDTVNDISVLHQGIESADAIAVVLPPDKLAELMKIAGDKPVLRSSIIRVATGKTYINANGNIEAEFQFVHDYWEQIIKLEFQSRRL